MSPIAPIIKFPDSQDKRLQRAIALYKEKGPAVALSKFIDLIDSACVQAYAFVGAIYEAGGPGVNINLEKALFYYLKSAEECGTVEAYLALGRFYYYGLGVDKDYNKAFEYYSIVVHDCDSPVANLMLGRMYHHGKGLIKDIDKAKYYYKKAEDLGNVFGITYQGLIEIESGNYVKGLLLRAKAAVLALIIAIKDKRDYRLRRC